MSDETTTPGRSTLLEAVNTLLDCIGEQPVSTLAGQQVGECQRAKAVLMELHRAMQVRGWSFNTDSDFPLTRASTGEVIVPENLAQFAPSRQEWGGRFQSRGNRLYDTQERTTTISESISEVRGEAIWYLPWEQCPEVFNRFVTCRGARVFVVRALGDEGQARLVGLDETEAEIALQRYQLATTQPNSLFVGGAAFPTFYPSRGLRGRLRGDLEL